MQFAFVANFLQSIIEKIPTFVFIWITSPKHYLNGCALRNQRIYILDYREWFRVQNNKNVHPKVCIRCLIPHSPTWDMEWLYNVMHIETINNLNQFKFEFFFSWLTYPSFFWAEIKLVGFSSAEYFPASHLVTWLFDAYIIFILKWVAKSYKYNISSIVSKNTSSIYL